MLYNKLGHVPPKKAFPLGGSGSQVHRIICGPTRVHNSNVTSTGWSAISAGLMHGTSRHTDRQCYMWTTFCQSASFAMQSNNTGPIFTGLVHFITEHKLCISARKSDVKEQIPWSNASMNTCEWRFKIQMSFTTLCNHLNHLKHLHSLYLI